jgi:hypothetical protein
VLLMRASGGTTFKPSDRTGTDGRVIAKAAVMAMAIEATN